MDDNRPEDEALVARLLIGDQRALQICYERNAAAMLGLARRVLADDHRAEEVVQEVFVRLWTDPARFDPTRGALRSFLYRETHSRAIERVRSEHSRRAREMRDLGARPFSSRVDDVEQEAWTTVRADLVHDALAALAVGERDAIELAYYGGYSYREVARLLDVPEGTVKSRIRLGLAKLADLLNATGVETSS